MAKRQNNQHKVGAMVPYGKPVEVIYERLMPDKDGRMTRYIEHLPGVTSASGDDVIKAGPDRGDFHSGECRGRVGVARTWSRDDRTWCLGCYRMKYGRAPTTAELTPLIKKRAVAPPKKASRRDFGL